jgi:hypothetical protein
MKKTLETALLNSVKSLLESINLIEDAHMGSQAELQRLLAQSSRQINPSQPTRPNAPPTPGTSPNGRAATPADIASIQRAFGNTTQEQPQQAAPPESLDDVAKQRAFERPFITPNSKKETPFNPSPEDAFYDPYYSPEQFKGDFTNNPKEADRATQFQRKWNGEPAYPRQFFQTPNGPRSTVIKPTDPVAEDVTFRQEDSLARIIHLARG